MEIGKVIKTSTAHVACRSTVKLYISPCLSVQGPVLILLILDISRLASAISRLVADS